MKRLLTFLMVFSSVFFLGMSNIFAEENDEIDNEIRDLMVQHMLELKENEEELNEHQMKTLQEFEALTTEEQETFFDAMANPKVIEQVLSDDEGDINGNSINVEETIEFKEATPNQPLSTVQPLSSSNLTAQRSTSISVNGVTVTTFTNKLWYTYSHSMGRVTATSNVLATISNGNRAVDYRLTSIDNYVLNGAGYGHAYWQQYAKFTGTPMSTTREVRLRVDRNNNSHITMSTLH
ncbi:hypothetical protein AB3N04_00970 (plasmid) [Alkalihalophilus sp. As8PL]|uniref:Uncharacterized protein n=1 Tax=Alkalihalophilus sp. As8PL TaxID=3237103 RepID=A0AB39BNB4_9BACI